MTDIKPAIIITDLPDTAPSSPEEALSWLGGTVEEVAEGLRARGIKGKQGIANACPLASYLNIWWRNASVWGEVSILDDETDYYFVQPTPGHLFAFVSHFDAGAFPDLIAD